LGQGLRDRIEKDQLLKAVYEAKLANLALVENFGESIPFNEFSTVYK
jgi:hypothetical protein